jgi:AcrR family transcriptional regulator
MEVKRKVTRLSRADRSKAILLAAREVFEAKGYEKATVAEIAKHVGVVEGTVLHYFPSKRALVINVTAAFYEALIESLQEGLEGIEGFRNRFYYVIHSHLTALKNSSALCAVILSESRGIDDEVVSKVHDFNKRYTGILMDVLVQGQGSEEISQSVSRALIRNVVFGTIEHYLWDIISGHPLDAVDAIASQLTTLILDGVGVEPVPSNESNELRDLVGRLNKLVQ